MDDLKQEVSQLNTQLRKLLGQLVSAEPEVRETFEYFVEVRLFFRIQNKSLAVRDGVMIYQKQLQGSDGSRISHTGGANPKEGMPI